MQVNQSNFTFYGPVTFATGNSEWLGDVKNIRESTPDQNPLPRIFREDNPLQPAMQETSHQHPNMGGRGLTTDIEQGDLPTSGMPGNRIMFCGFVILMGYMYFKSMTDWVLTLACWAIDVPMHQEMDSDGNPSPLHAWLSTIYYFPPSTSDHCFQLSSSYIQGVLWKRFYSVMSVATDAWVELVFGRNVLYGPHSM
jgi:hypothetical protein